MMSGERTACPSCSTFLIEPFIRCAECADPKLEICLHCFARGVQFGGHLSDHKYEVIKHNFSVFEKTWTAAEELELVRAVAECGFGNWQDVSNQVRTKTKQECRAHYFKFYVDGGHADMPVFGNDDFEFVPAPIPVRYGEDPPRPTHGSPWQLEMAGYMPARGDFTTEHDNFAEMDVKDIYFNEENEDKLEMEAKLAVMDIYRSRLKERQRRKRIIKHYGLLNVRKNHVLHLRYEKSLPFVHKLRAFMRLMMPTEYIKYLELLSYEYQLKDSIKSLQELREAGITCTRAGSVYKRLLKRKEWEKPKRHLLSDVLNQAQYQDEAACANWLQRQAALESLSKGIPTALPQPARRVFPPLKIVDLPGFEKLNDKEKELCSTVRLIPMSFLKCKSVLEDECKKNGLLKLAQARALLKMDVNKTRKLYDFLLQEGTINKDILS